METFTRSIIIVSIFLFVVLVGIQIILEYYFPNLRDSYVMLLAGLMKVNEDTITWQNATWTIVFPLIASLTIIYALLDQINIFGGSSKSMVYFIIALAWTGSLIATGALSTWVMWIYTAGAIWSVVLIVVGVVIGAFFKYVLTRVFSGWSHFRGARAASPSIEARAQLNAEIADIQNKIDDLRSKRANLIKKASDMEPHDFQRQMEWIEGQLEGYERKMNEVIRMAGREEAAA